MVTFGLPLELAHPDASCMTRTYWLATRPSVAPPVGLAVPVGLASAELSRFPVTITSLAAESVSGVL